MFNEATVTPASGVAVISTDLSPVRSASRTSSDALNLSSLAGICSVTLRSSA